ncbi:MAG TPA: hypothetical protein VFE46_07285 [Pirellulales bacterium]|jgi:hypothetical protein|nr:hypothetical protein [Pirellulales bacterium]
MWKKLLLAGIAILPLAGCIISENPLSDPKGAKSDKALIGDWVYRDANGQKGYLHIGEGVLGKQLGWMEVIKVKGNSEFDPTHNFAFPSEVGDHKYFNVVMLKFPVDDYKEKSASDILKGVSQYAVFKYEVDSNGLTIWEADKKVLDQAVKKGEIKGDGIVLKDTTENFRKFVAAHDAELFNSDDKTHCEKLTE